MIKPIQILAVLTLLTISNTLNFHLSRHRQHCYLLKGNTKYEFQFLVAGQGETNVACNIFDGNKLISEIRYKSEQDLEFTLESEEGRICFSNLDTAAKQISFDFIETNDPLKSSFTEERKQKTHELLYHAYSELNRVYRDQHFLLERKHVHDNVLIQAQKKLFTITAAKIIVIVLASFVQLFLIKKIANGEFTLFRSSFGAEDS